MGGLWEANWCRRCSHDHGMHNGNDDTSNACEIILRHMVDDYPIEELTELDHGHDGWGPCCLTCSKFSPCVECGVDPDLDLDTAARSCQ